MISNPNVFLFNKFLDKMQTQISIENARIFFVPTDSAEIIGELLIQEIGPEGEGWERDPQNHYVLEEGPYAFFGVDSNVVTDGHWNLIKDKVNYYLHHKLDTCVLWDGRSF